jgi:hypothetical protein
MGALSSLFTSSAHPYVCGPIRRGFDLPPTLCVNAAVSKDGRSLVVNFDHPVPPRDFSLLMLKVKRWVKSRSLRSLLFERCLSKRLT